MKHILITGGNGYIGQYAVDYFLKNGYQVTITLRDTNINYTSASARIMDLSDNNSIKDICNGVDVVIHTATMDERAIPKNPRDALLLNGYATRELYLDAVNCGVSKFIYLSTFHVYGSSHGYINECTFVHPQSDYGLTHYVAELYLQQLSAEYNLPCNIMRLSNGISAPPKGVDRWYLVLNDFCKTIYETGEIIIKSSGLPLRDFIAIPDVVCAMQSLIETSNVDACEVYNISSNKAISVRELMQKVVHVYQVRYGQRAKVIAPEITLEQIAAVEPLNIDNEKLCALGWQPTYAIEDVINAIFDSIELKKNSGE